MMRRIAVLATVWVLSSCTTQQSETAVIPTDGIHVTGAISAIVPLAGGGSCPALESPSGTRLGIFANPNTGNAYVAAVVENFTGPKTYTYAKPQAESYWRLDV